MCEKSNRLEKSEVFIVKGVPHYPSLRRNKIKEKIIVPFSNFFYLFKPHSSIVVDSCSIYGRVSQACLAKSTSFTLDIHNMVN